MTHSLWIPGLLAAIALFQAVAVPALILRKNDLADVLWGPAFPIAALAAAYWGGVDLSGLNFRQTLVLVLLIVWAARLFLHVGSRNLTHRKEDVRYNNWRKQWGRTWVWRSYLQVFVLQALILYVFLLPVLYILAYPSVSFGPLGYVGLLVWMIGIFFETVGDSQLRRFKTDPANRGKLMTKGLWGWTRHPNYFGEVVLWWGIWLMAVELPGSIWTVIAPIGVTYLILKVSGVSMLEDLMKSRPGYADYVRSVPSFFPRPPKKITRTPNLTNSKSG